MNDQEQFDRLPPHSIEAEICLLGSMLLDRDVIAIRDAQDEAGRKRRDARECERRQERRESQP